VPEGSRAYEEAQCLGRLLAGAGFAVMSGGYFGVMAAVSRGAWEVGGHTIGVTLAAFDRWASNPWLKEERKAPDLFARQRWLIGEADGIIVLPGGVGTLAEFSVTWNLVQIGGIGLKPVVLVGQAWRGMLVHLGQHLHLRARDLTLLKVVGRVEEGVQALLEQLEA
jgi:uncharacterized protein (TIGR00730 family)